MTLLTNSKKMRLYIKLFATKTDCLCLTDQIQGDISSMGRLRVFAFATVFLLNIGSGHAQWSGCPNIEESDVQGVLTIDMSERVTQEFIDIAKAQGIKAIIRYYDWAILPGKQYIVHLDQDWEQIPSLCGDRSILKTCGQRISDKQRKSVVDASQNSKCVKVITSPELKLIHQNKMDVGIVFQHWMGCTNTWRDTKRAAYDADRAIEMARSLQQPSKTAIYFGVDGADETFKGRGSLKEGETLIENYFAVVSKKLRNAGFEIGVYGSGLSCRRLRDELQYVKYCWLSMSTGHPESKNYEEKNNWDIKQCRERNINNTGYSPDVLNNRKSDFGFWSPPRQ